jgi:hypothetical protein
MYYPETISIRRLAMKSINPAAGFLCMAVFVSLSVDAATLVETQGEHGMQKMWVEGSNMRVDMGKGSEYMLADYAKKKIYMIDPAKKEMVDMSQFISESTRHSDGLQVRVKLEGSGPKVAGYSTQKYALSVNGRPCKQALVSHKALEDAKLGPMLEAISSIDINPMGSQFMSECDRAGMLFAKRMKKLGMPLGMIEANGKLTDKVERIVKNAPLPAGGFKLPSGYRKISMQQKMMDALGIGNASGAGKALTPEMKKMMEEMMKQGGR